MRWPLKVMATTSFILFCSFSELKRGKRCAWNFITLCFSLPICTARIKKQEKTKKYAKRARLSHSLAI